MSKERAIIVGAGGISRAWFPRLIKEKIDIASVVDLDKKRAQQRIDEYELDAEASDDLSGAIKRTEADFVVDLTIPEAHCKVTCTALRAGCHVIGEKPMASSMAEARRMVKASEQSGKLYMVSQSRRYTGRHRALAKELQKGRLGQLTTLNCDFFMAIHFGGFREEMDSPLILDMSIHHFDLARMISGCDPVAVYAHEFNPAGSWYKGDVSASCVFEMSNGVVFSYRGSWAAAGMPTSWHGDWRIIGEKGTILYARDQQPVGQVLAAKSGKEREVAVKDLADRYPGQHGALREFLRGIRGGEVPQGECHDNIKSLAMVFACIESSRRKRRVTIDL